MAREAVARLVRADGAACGFIERWRRFGRIANCPIQSLNLFEEADAALVERSVVPEDVGLPGLALPEGVENRLRKSLFAIGHNVDALLAAPRDLVSVRPCAENKLRVG